MFYWIQACSGSSTHESTLQHDAPYNQQRVKGMIHVGFKPLQCLERNILNLFSFPELFSCLPSGFEMETTIFNQTGDHVSVIIK